METERPGRPVDENVQYKIRIHRNGGREYNAAFDRMLYKCGLLQLSGGSCRMKNRKSCTIGRAILKYSSLPKLDVVNFFERTLFSWLTGNNDMHLKNFSLYETVSGIRLTPAYDLLNAAVERVPVAAVERMPVAAVEWVPAATLVAAVKSAPAWRENLEGSFLLRWNLRNGRMYEYDNRQNPTVIRSCFLFWKLYCIFVRA